MDTYLTIEQLAQRLAVTPKALRQRLWRAPTTLPPAIRLGKLVRFSAISVDAWMATQRSADPSTHQPRGRPRKRLQLSRRSARESKPGASSPLDCVPVAGCPTAQAPVPTTLGQPT